MNPSGSSCLVNFLSLFTQRRAAIRDDELTRDEAGRLRSEKHRDAPDIDGRVYVPGDLPIGEFAHVTVTGFSDYDLIALPAGQMPATFKVAKMAS